MNVASRPIMMAASTLVLTLAGCSPSDDSVATTPDGRTPPARIELGAFPAYPETALPGDVAAALQATLDDAVADGTVGGVTASVIAIGEGSWSGAAGLGEGGRTLEADSRLEIASVAKTMTAAQILQLIEQGRLRLKDSAAHYVAPDLEPADLNDATIEDLLGMRSGFMDPANFDAFETRGETLDLVAALEPFARPGEGVAYANVNYYLLGVIIEQVTGQRWPLALSRGVLTARDFDEVRLEGLQSGSDVLTDATTLARWGHELYGGSVLSDASLREMTSFRGEFYGLGAIDFTHPDAEYGYDVESIGHGGQGDLVTVRLVVFPETGVVVAVQANAHGFDKIHSIVESLRKTART